VIMESLRPVIVASSCATVSLPLAEGRDEDELQGIKLLYQLFRTACLEACYRDRLGGFAAADEVLVVDGFFAVASRWRV